MRVSHLSCACVCVCVCVRAKGPQAPRPCPCRSRPLPSPTRCRRRWRRPPPLPLSLCLHFLSAPITRSPLCAHQTIRPHASRAGRVQARLGGRLVQAGRGRSSPPPPPGPAPWPGLAVRRAWVAPMRQGTPWAAAAWKGTVTAASRAAPAPPPSHLPAIHPPRPAAVTCARRSSRASRGRAPAENTRGVGVPHARVWLAWRALCARSACWRSRQGGPEAKKRGRVGERPGQSIKKNDGKFFFMLLCFYDLHATALGRRRGQVPAGPPQIPTAEPCQPPGPPAPAPLQGACLGGWLGQSRHVGSGPRRPTQVGFAGAGAPGGMRAGRQLLGHVFGRA